jgi:hypothetical protein
MDGEETLDLGTQEEPVEGGQEQVEELVEPTGDEGQEPTEGTESEQVGTGPKNIRAALKAASEASPEQAGTLKELGNSYYREQAYKAQFPTVEEAQTAKNLIEAIGGVDGASTLQARVQEYDTQETGLEAGDPSVLDSFFKDYPQQAVQLASAYLERVAAQNPQEFQKAIGPYAIQMIEQSNIPSYIDMALRETDPARKDETLKQISQYLQGQITTSKQALQSNTSAQTTKPFEKERETLNKEREETFNDGVRMHIDHLSLPVINGEVDKYTKQYGLNDDQKKLFWSNLFNKVKGQMDEDSTHKKQVDIRVKAKGRTSQSVAKYISDEFNRRVKVEAFGTLKECEKVFGPLKGGRKMTTGLPKAGGPKTSPSGGPLRVSARPADADIDWSKPDADMNLIKGRAYLKSGKFVAWRG